MRTYEITPRAETLGGGWSLKLYESGQEMGGGVYPPVHDPLTPDFDGAWQDAQEEAESWIGADIPSENPGQF